MKHVLRTEDKKKVVIDIENDSQLYAASAHRETRGTDLYAHRAQSGKIFFYMHEWSRWEGEVDQFILISRDKVEDRLIRLAGLCGDAALTEAEFQRAEEFGFNLLEETAQDENMNKVQEYMVKKYKLPYTCLKTGETRPLWQWHVALHHDVFIELTCNGDLVRVAST